MTPTHDSQQRDLIREVLEAARAAQAVALTEARRMICAKYPLHAHRVAAAEQDLKDAEDALVEHARRGGLSAAILALPLPSPDTHCFDDDSCRDVWSHSAGQMVAMKQAAAGLALEFGGCLAEYGNLTVGAKLAQGDDHG